MQHPHRPLELTEILLHSGHYFDFLKPEQTPILIEDIAFSLSHINRFNGHTKFAYSVAQHSVLVSHLVPPEFALQGLLHDAVEAYIGDMSTPLKSLVPQFREVENRIEKVILGAFGLSHPLAPEVKRADLIMLATERRDLLKHQDRPWFYLDGVEAAPLTIDKMTAESAETMFLLRFHELTG